MADKPINAIPVACFALFLLSGCQMAKADGIAIMPPPASVGATDPASSELVKISTLLAMGEGAAANDDTAALAKIVMALDALGVKAAAASEDPMPEWRRMAAAELSTTPPDRGRLLGPAFRKGWLNAGQSYALNQTFLAGKRARIALSSHDNMKVHFSVSDGGKRNPCDTARSCEWMPLFTQRYQITLENPTSKSASYYLVID
ncbi:MAG: hypothetical protein HC843_03095 [Sphingomonadales bacterium]|nr:hypothetical protein [Sphingomonadales bacterium]